MKQTPSQFRTEPPKKLPWLWTSVALLAAAAIWVVPPVTAAASCAGRASAQEAIGSAPTVFVGTVIGLSSGDRVASVRVDDIWRGSTIPSSVDVVGTPDLNAGATSIDRTYVAGSQYLFVPDGGGPQRFTDNNCTATQVYTPSLAAMRPAGAPGAPSQSAATFPLTLVLGALVLVLVAASIPMLVRWRGGSRSA